MDITGTLIQPQIALTMLISGIIAGAAFLIATYIQTLWRYKWVEILTDFLAAAFSGAMFLLSIYITTKGDLRSYLFLCFFLGMFLIIRIFRRCSLLFHYYKDKRKSNGNHRNNS